MNRREAIKNQVFFVFGTGLSTTLLSNLLGSCKNTPDIGWQPLFFTVDQANTLVQITETILPKTQTPGAADIGVAQFIDKVIGLLLNNETQQEIVKGIAEIDSLSESRFNKNFILLSMDQKKEILLDLDKQAGSYPLTLWGITLQKPGPVSFFRHLKRLTLFAYFTSEEIGKGVLRYDPVPGDYLSCIPLAGQNTWTE
jgi:hypothetical protein